jgi:hypothetical protein
LLQDFSLDHGDTILLNHGRVFRLLDHIAKDGQNDARDLILDAIVQNVTQNGNDFVSRNLRNGSG